MSNILQKMILSATILSLSLPSLASAHNIGENSINNAAFHLFLNLDHLIAVTALVILGKQLSRKIALKKLAFFVPFVALGGILAFAAPLLLIGVCASSSLVLLYQSRSWKAEK